MTITTSRSPKLRLLSLAGCLGVSLAALQPVATQNAVANGDTRTIHLYHVHTGESISATFRVNGQYDQASLKKLNWFLRDWRTDEPTSMNPRLFDVIWETYRESGSRQPIHIVSAYRSPKTNAMLRRRSRAVAEHSQHILGRAMDMHYVDVSMSKVREIAMKLQRGGVGYYPTAGTPFVHLDVGSVRAWPRMSYDQLARLFPDGKTVHLPASGQPLARYEEARAEIESRGDAPVMVASADTGRRSRGFFDRLFGVGEEDEDTGAVVAPRGRTRIARVTTADKDDAAEIQTPSQRRAAETIERAERNLPRGETIMSAPNAPTPPVIPVQVAAVAVAPSNMPLPPRRPAEMGGAPAAAIAFANVPLPPVRPALVTVAANEKAPAVLPDVIRQGTDPAPAGVMAYAGALELRGTVPGLVQSLQPQRPVVVRRTQLYAARLDRTNFELMTRPIAMTEPLNVARDIGMRPGLKASVKAESRLWAMTAAVQVESDFGPTLVSDLRTDAFTGPAVRPVEPRTTAQTAQGRIGLAALIHP